VGLGRAWCVVYTKYARARVCFSWYQATLVGREVTLSGICRIFGWLYGESSEWTGSDWVRGVEGLKCCLVCLCGQRWCDWYL
jgi:hypothetical protein